LDTKDFSDYIGPSPNSKTDNENNSSGLPSYAIAIIVVAAIIILLIIGYLVYRKRRQSKPKKNRSTQSLQEVWATPQNAIVNTKTAENTDTGLTGNTATNKSPLNSDFEDKNKGPDSSRMTEFYMDLPYFQHEVDTHDTQIDYLAKDQQNQPTK
jgi:cytoskeletal protein RodZ